MTKGEDIGALFPLDLAQWLRTSGHDGEVSYRVPPVYRGLVAGTIRARGLLRIEERELEAGGLSPGCQ